MGQRTSGKRILFVDDEASIRLTLPPVLQQAGFDVHVAESVGDAIFEINSYQFDALISDLNIGEEGDGFLVTSAMRHIQPNCVTFILTGYPAFETALQAIHSQVDDYLVKPVEVESLITAVSERLRNRLTKPSLPVKRLSSILREDVASIVKMAVTSLKRDGRASDRGLVSQDLAGHFTSFVNSLADQIDAEAQQISNEALHSAADYGKARTRKKGTSSTSIAHEFAQLENALYEQLQRNPTSPEAVNSLITDLKTLNRGLNLLLQRSLESFEKTKLSGSQK